LCFAPLLKKWILIRVFAPLLKKWIKIIFLYNMKTKDICKGLSFEECELAILRVAVDKSDKKIGKRIINSPDIKKIINILEEFLRDKKLICYGGQSINEELPENDRFYDKDVDLPDYDFYSPNALHDAKELADIYYAEGFTEVEAKAGQHHGTYKVYVNFYPIADVSFIPQSIFDVLKKDSIKINGILYAPPNFLKMAMYLELSRPIGDTSRFEKVLKRLTLFNKNYPILGENCNHINFQRKMTSQKGSIDGSKENIVHDNIKTTFINEGVVFFGGFAISLYSKYMPHHLRKKVQKIADFDVLSNNPKKTAEMVKERLSDINIHNVKIIQREQIGEIIPEHYEIKIENDTVAFIYKPIACHSYNFHDFQGKQIKVATIDTMLSFYLAFLYANKSYYNDYLDRILCMSKFLFDVQQKNRLNQKGLLKRFTSICYGHQNTLEEMRAIKAEKYKELKDKKDSPEFEEWFLNYKPSEINEKSSLKKESNNIQKNNIQKIKEKREIKNKKTKKNHKSREVNKSKKQKFFNLFKRNKSKKIL
jgi:hypothetical protein